MRSLHTSVIVWNVSMSLTIYIVNIYLRFIRGYGGFRASGYREASSGTNLIQSLSNIQHPRHSSCTWNLFQCRSLMLMHNSGIFDGNRRWDAVQPPNNTQAAGHWNSKLNLIFTFVMCQKQVCVVPKLGVAQPWRVSKLLERAVENENELT